MQVPEIGTYETSCGRGQFAAAFRIDVWIFMTVVTMRAKLAFGKADALQIAVA